MTRRKSCALLGVAVAGLLLTGCQAGPTDRVSASADLIARYTSADDAGCSAAVGIDGKIAWAGAGGLADVDSATPLTTDSIFDLASVSKQFTGVAILLLEQDGLLTLDDPLSRFVPGLAADLDRVSVRDLLHHTSGIPDYTSLLDADLDQPATQEDAIAVIAALPRLSNGSGFDYSNSNYVLLAEIVRAASGLPLGEYLEQRVFGPLDLDMRLEPLYDAPQVAIGHEKGEPVVSRWTQIGDGSVYATPSELVRWADNYRTGQLGGDALLGAQISGAVDTGAASSYGAGIEIAPDGAISHLGGWAGVVTVFGVTGDRHTSIAVSCNSLEGNAGTIAEGLRQIWT